MKKVYAFVLLCFALNASGAPVTNVQNLAKFGLVSSMSMTDLFAIEINSHPRGITGANVSNLFGSSIKGIVSGSTNIVLVTNSGVVTILLTNLSAGASFTGSTNFLQLSVQSAKLPTTNYPGIDAGWQDWELLYYKTNIEGGIASLSSQFQFIMPQDYATNTFKLRIYSTLLTTNGPNTSNTIFRASVIRAQPGSTTDLHVGSFGTAVSGTNTWTASGTVTNQVKSLVINMSTSSAIQAGDLCILKLDRDAADDTYGGVTAVVGLQGEYTRP